MARRKIVFVIVEGPSDDEALGLFLTRFFDKNVVHVYIYHGDMTTMPGNIKNRITEVMKEYADTKLKKTDFQEVIHIVDMDGVYVSDSAVIYDELADHPFYSTTEIRTKDPEGIIERNHNKRRNIELISTLPTVWGTVPYHAYYMSCNLDHVLYNKLNCSDKEKERNAFEFARQYKNNLPGFISFISDSDFSLKGRYLDTWKYIKEENQLYSLERHTNLGLCFITIKN